jgi:hypothetical protein
VISDSMHPTILRGEEVECELCSPHPGFGDLVLYVNGAGQTVVHRVLGRRVRDGKTVLLESGDANWDAGHLAPERVIGWVRFIHTKAGCIDTCSLVARCLARITALIVAGSIWLGYRLPSSRRMTGPARRSLLKAVRILMVALCRVKQA